LQLLFLDERRNQNLAAASHHSGRTVSHRVGHVFDLIPLPHPSGASPWHKISPGKQLLEKAMRKIARHLAIVDLRAKL
jgi:hypothetical protein